MTELRKVEPKKNEGTKAKTSPKTVTLKVNRSFGSFSGPSYLERITTIAGIQTKLNENGIEPLVAFLITYPDTVVKFVYGLTSLGQHVLVELPDGIRMDPPAGIQIKKHEFDIVTSDVRETFDKALTETYTGYCFIGESGITYVRKSGEPAECYAYVEQAKSATDLELTGIKYIVLPTVQFENLMPMDRMNTIESVFADDPFLSEYLNGLGLLTFFSLKGPFTVFLPSDKKLKTLERLPRQKQIDIIMAGVITGKHDSGVVKLKSLMGNQLAINFTKRVLKANGIAEQDGSNKEVFFLEPISKFNGLVFRTNAVFKPVTENFEAPAILDLDGISTILDINMTSATIRAVNEQLNSQRQEQMQRLFKQISASAGELGTVFKTKLAEIRPTIATDTNRFLGFFYSATYPCTELCEEQAASQEKLSRVNAKASKLSSLSNKFSSLKTKIERLYLDLERIHRDLNQVIDSS